MKIDNFNYARERFEMPEEHEYTTKFEQGLKQIVATSHNGNPSHIKKVIDQIRAIMPPTCTPNERAFLDEIRENFKYSPGSGTIFRAGVILYPSNFPGINLKELVNDN